MLRGQYNGSLRPYSRISRPEPLLFLSSIFTWPPLWSSGESSWLQIQRSGFDSRRYQIFWEVVGLERGPSSLVSTTEELLVRISSGSGLECRYYGRWDPLCWPRNTFYPQKLTLTSPTSGGSSVGIVRSRTKATEFVLSLFTVTAETYVDAKSLYTYSEPTKCFAACSYAFLASLWVM
jgi:hypothetical protein